MTAITFSQHANEDKRLPINYRKVDVIVTIGGVVPTGGGTVTLFCTDPENASVPRATGKEDTPDNYDGIDIFNGARTISVKFAPGGPVTQTVTATVGIHAGDNYSILAFPSSCKPYVKSETLTVWRRLWVELDQMAAPTEGTGPNQFNPAAKYTPGASGDRGDITKNQWMDGNADTRPGNPAPPVGPVIEPMDFDVKFQPPLPSLTLATEHFAKACVLVQGVSSEQVKQWSGKTQLEDPNFKKYLPPSYGTVDDGRDIDAATNMDDFWILHALGTYKSEEGKDFDRYYDAFTLGVAQFNGSILIYQEEIRDYVATAQKYVPNLPASIVDMSEARLRVMYHELVHYFVGDHLWPIVQSVISDVGIMNTNRESTQYMLFITADIELTPLQISSIQAAVKPGI